MRALLALIVACCAAIPAASNADAAPTVQHRSRVRPALQKQIRGAIGRGLEYLSKQRFKHGRAASKSAAQHADAGLALYAAMHAGMKRDSNEFRSAIRRLSKTSPARTYERACAILALAHANRGPTEDNYRSRIQGIASKLVASQNSEGSWGYPAGDDLSNTQYAALGLWAAVHAGATVPAKTWVKLAEGLEGYLQPDGGFSYGRSGARSTLSMTAAGAACATMALEMLQRDAAGRKLLKDPLRRRLLLMEARALEWMGDRYAPGASGGGGWSMYAMYGVERAAALARAQRLGSHDWYAEGALYLVGTQGANGAWGGAGGDVVSTCFGVLFLARATGRSISQPVTGVRPDPKVEIAAAMRRRDLGRNRMAAGKPVVTASSTTGRGHGASQLVDGFADTYWQSRESDRMPRLRFVFREPQEVDTLVVAFADVDEGVNVDHPSQVRLVVNGMTTYSVAMPEDRRFKGRVELPVAVTVETLEVEVVTVGKGGGVAVEQGGEEVLRPIVVGDVEVQMRR